MISLNRMKKQKIIEILWFLIVVVLFFLSLQLIRSGDLDIFVTKAGIFAPIILLLLKMTTLIVAPLGGSPLYIIAGALFGGFKGFLLTLSGDILGSAVCFFLSRRYGERVLSTFVGSQNKDRVVGAVSLLGNTSSIVKARLAFISIPELLSYAAGLSRVSFWKFMLINALFYIPVDLTLVVLGSQIANITAKYFLLLPIVIFILSAIGFATLYSDYQKIEGA